MITETDVVMLTRNSCRPWLKKCLISVKREVPVKQLILVDCFSKDGTVSVVKTVFPEALVVSSKQCLGLARKEGIEKVRTDWFAFVDSDIELLPGWWKKVTSLVEDRVGAVQGSDIPADPILRTWILWQERKWRPRVARIGKRQILEVHSQNTNRVRGYTHNTLIRTNAAKHWNPPHWLHIGEDYYLMRHIVQRGYQWRILDMPVAKHYSPSGLEDAMTKAAREMSTWRYLKKAGLKPWCSDTITGLTSCIKNLAIESGKSLISAIETGEPRIIPYITLKYLAFMRGYLQWTTDYQLRGLM